MPASMCAFAGGIMMGVEVPYEAWGGAWTNITQASLLPSAALHLGRGGRPAWHVGLPSWG